MGGVFLSTIEVMVQKVSLREGGNSSGRIAYKAKSTCHAFDLGTSAMIKLGTAGT